ncbi:MAG: helix-turn-helix transcriptional regulator [Cyclobacteriaceae bacterium]
MAQNISKKLSFIGENIKKIRQTKRISQAEFASLFNLARPSIGAYEEGRSEPKIDTLIQIAGYFNISIDVLLTRKLTVSEIYSIDLLNQKLNKAHKLEPKKNNISEPKNNGISLVQVHQYLDYIVSHNTKDFINTLTQINLPVKDPSLYRAFEMNGSEMEYHQQGLHHGDILVGKRIELDSLHQYEKKIITVVNRENITTRRMVSHQEELLKLSADDPNYPELIIQNNDLIEIWSIESVYSKYLNPPSIVEERVLKLEKKMEEALQKISML